jgi:hypothetical protein
MQKLLYLSNGNSHDRDRKRRHSKRRLRKKVDVKGVETFEFNALFLSTLRSIPENITVQKETQ